MTTSLLTLVALHAVAWAALMVVVNRLRDRKYALSDTTRTARGR